MQLASPGAIRKSILPLCLNLQMHKQLFCLNVFKILLRGCSLSQDYNDNRPTDCFKNFNMQISLCNAARVFLVCYMTHFQTQIIFDTCVVSCVFVVRDWPFHY